MKVVLGEVALVNIHGQEVAQVVIPAEAYRLAVLVEEALVACVLGPVARLWMPSNL